MIESMEAQKESAQVDSETTYIKENSKAAEKSIHIIREASLLQLKTLTVSSDVSIKTDLTSDGFYWMSLNLVAGQDFRLLLKYQYKSQPIMQLAGNVIKNEQFKNSPNSFMNSFCTSVTQLIAASLERRGIRVQIIPSVITREFDQVFLPKETYRLLFTDTWALGKDSQNILCHSSMEIINPEVLKEFRNLADDLSFFSKVVTWADGIIQQ